MNRAIYNIDQTIEELVELIESKFSYIKMSNFSELEEILGVKSDRIRIALLASFGKKYGVLSFEESCRKLNISTELPKGKKSVIAFHKLCILYEAINNNWKPDWNNSNQNKYYPYFYMRNGVSFDTVHCSWADAHSTVGSLLCADTEEKAYFMGNYYIELYKDFMGVV